MGLDDGWKEVREMTENETKAFEIVRKYGKYAKLETEKEPENRLLSVNLIVNKIVSTHTHIQYADNYIIAKYYHKVK